MSNTFEHLGLPDQMMAALKRMNFTTPTPIQSQTIPVAMQGRDILGSAQTGTGKTGAFCIPMIAKLMADDRSMALIVTPTRELATQILDVVHKLTSNNRAIRTALLIGGDSMGKQFAQLRDRPRLIVGTPGRINDHLRRDPRLLSQVVYVAIDEADRMLDMGFSVQLDEILKTLPRERQTLMFSATFPDAIVKFSRSYLNNPERISVNPESVTVTKIKHEMKRTTDANKYVDLLAELEVRDGSVIIFVKTQHGTDRLAKRLENDNHGAVAIHGGLRQNQRDRAVQAFRSKRYRIMVATDVASRGLDIPHIEHVINYDLPQVAEDYIHRIGRTARAGAEGNAMAFVLPSDGIMWNQINRIMNPGAAPERFEGGRSNRGGFKSGGYKGSKSQGGGRVDYKKRNTFGGGWDDKNRDDRKSYGQKPSGGDNRKPSYNDDRKFPSRDSRPSVAAERKEGGKPFVKFYNRDSGPSASSHGENRDRPKSDRNWNHKDNRAKYNADQGRFEQPAKGKWDAPRQEGRGDGRQGNDRGNDRGSDRGSDRFNDRPAARRDSRPSGNFRNDGPREGKRDVRSEGRSENRNFGNAPSYKKDSHFGEKPARDDRGNGFKSDAPRKPRSDKAGSKKPFKFKEHSRKPGAKPHGDARRAS